MCGILGTLGRLARTDAAGHWLAEAGEAIRHRGPDDAGVWLDREAGVALGHRRLSILDLSPLGHQPMASASGRLVLSYNGEVYNFAEIRQALEARGVRFRSHSDTEVILEAVEAWGLDEALSRFVGMFAIAIWDRHTRTLQLVRDRLGIKPLYYGHVGGDLVFASELRPFRLFPGFEGRVDRGALALFMRHNYVPAPHTIFEGVRKLRPGHVLTVTCDERTGYQSAEHAFWSLREVVERAQQTPFEGGDDAAVEALEAQLAEAVRLRMIADVPVGAFLSGGVDSSTVVALMQAQASGPVHTFSIGFKEAGFDEAGYARAVAAHLGTHHTELYVTPAEARAVIPRLPELFDEPFGDSSQIPTFLVSELARRHVTVSLSGDGGDELFAGYGRYARMQRLWKQIGRVPPFLRRPGGQVLAAAAAGGALLGMDRSSGLRRAVARARRGGTLLRTANAAELYRQSVSHWSAPEEAVIGAREPETVLSSPALWPRALSLSGHMQFVDTLAYLPDDILTKVDRASMAVSLEARVPLLDHRVVELAWRFPEHLKVRDGQSKWILRQVLYRHVPAPLIERPKMGFGVPVGAWLRGPLRAWADALLDPARLAQEAYFRPDPIHLRWREHLAGERDWSGALWPILMFQAWLGAQRP